MAMTYRGWICLDVDGECWGLSTGKDALHATAAEARASGIAEIERLMEGEPPPERDEQVERFKAEAVAVEVSVRVDSREAGLAAMRWITGAGLSDKRLPDPVESDVPTSSPDVSSDVGPRYLIEVWPAYQGGRGRWWRPDACGYTDDVLKAGVYTQAQVDDLLDETSHSRAVPAPGILALTDEQLAAINQFVTACATGWERRSEVDAGAIEDAYDRWVAAGRPLVPGRE